MNVQPCLLCGTMTQGVSDKGQWWRCGCGRTHGVILNEGALDLGFEPLGLKIERRSPPAAQNNYEGFFENFEGVIFPQRASGPGTDGPPDGQPRSG